MRVPQAVLLPLILAFGVLTGLALDESGYFGLLEAQMTTWAGMQVFADLVLACLLLCAWMMADARRSGVSPWPFVGLTLVLGSFGPLFYLVAREWKGTPAALGES